MMVRHWNFCSIRKTSQSRIPKLDHLNVGGTVSSTTRYDLKEFTRVTNVIASDGWEDAYLGTLSIPPGASSIYIYKLAWSIQGYHEDADESHKFDRYRRINSTDVMVMLKISVLVSEQPSIMK